MIRFAEATELAAMNAVRLTDDVTRLDDAVREELVAHRQAQGRSPARPRSDALVWRVLDLLPTDPMLTVDAVTARLGGSPAATHRALTELADAGILGRTKDHRGRLICWTADRYLALVALTERNNRVRGVDTRTHKPKLGPPAP